VSEETRSGTIILSNLITSSVSSAGYSRRHETFFSQAMNMSVVFFDGDTSHMKTDVT